MMSRQITVLARDHAAEFETLFDFGCYNDAAPDGASVCELRPASAQRVLDCGGKRSATPLSPAESGGLFDHHRPPESVVVAPALPAHSKTFRAGRAGSPLPAADCNQRILVRHADAHGVARPTFAPASWTAVALHRFYPGEVLKTDKKRPSGRFLV